MWDFLRTKINVFLFQDPKMTDYKWEIKQRKKQKDLFLNYRNMQPGDGNATQMENLRLHQIDVILIHDLFCKI